MELFVAGLEAGSIARHLGISKSAISRLLSGQYRFGALAGQDETTPELLASVAAEHLRRERERITERYLASAANLQLQGHLEAVGQRVLAGMDAFLLEG